jgi:hypothetical protein
VTNRQIVVNDKNRLRLVARYAQETSPVVGVDFVRFVPFIRCIVPIRLDDKKVAGQAFEGSRSLRLPIMLVCKHLPLRQGSGVRAFPDTPPVPSSAELTEQNCRINRQPINARTARCSHDSTARARDSVPSTFVPVLDPDQGTRRAAGLAFVHEKQQLPYRRNP